MKRYPVFAVAVLLFLLAVLLGSWVYLNNFPWPMFGDAPQVAVEPGTDTRTPGTNDDPFVDSRHAAENGEDTGDDDGRGGPLEVPDQPTRRANPPEPVNTGSGKKADVANSETKETIVAELTPGLAAVRDRNGGEEGLDPFIVSTLPSARDRQSYKTSTLFGESDESLERLVESDESFNSAHTQPRILDSVLKGEVVWPSLPEADAEALEQADRFQAIVYVAQLPEFRAIVDRQNRAFRLPLTTRMQDDYRSKGLKLVVHSPAFEIEGAFESVTVKQNDGPIKVALQLAAKIVVVVDVTPPEAIADGVRVWLERQGEPGGPDRDDSLYMSARVPSSGRLVFTVPEHYGEFRVAATGAQWHSGLPQILNVRDWRTAKVAVTLELVADSCDRITGAIKRDGGADYEQPLVAGARLQMTTYGTTVYTGPDGQFAIYMPADRARAERQLIVTADRLRPEVVVLDRADAGTEGVEGNGLSVPVRVLMAWSTMVRLRLPAELSHQATVSIMGLGKYGPIEISSNLTPDVEVPWGASVLVVSKFGEIDPDAVVLHISATAWHKKFQEYASGRDISPQISPVTLEQAFKNR